MSPSAATQRAIEMIEAQIADLAGIRNATARDPSFKNWRQATLTTMQRIWPGDQARSERFRRIPFSPADPRADHRAVREQYSRGCQEAGRVLASFLEEVRQFGVPEVSGEAAPVAPEAEFEDGFPTLDLPAGEVNAPTDPARLAENLLAGLGDEPPQGKDPLFAEPPRLPAAPPAPAVVASAPAAAPAPPAKKGAGMKARLRDLLGFAQLSAKSLAGFPRENAAPNPNPLGMTPLGEDVGHVQTPAPAPAAPVVEPAASDVPADWPVLPRRSPVETLPPVAETPAAVTPVAETPWAQTLSSVAAAANAVPDEPEVSMPAPSEPPASTPEPVASTPEPAAESSSVIMSRPTTLRGNIDKVSIESLISPEFRANESAAGDAAPAPAASAPVEPASAEVDTLPPAAVTPVPAASAPAPELRVVTGNANAPATSGATPSDPPKAERPPLSLVRPLLDDPEFNVEPSPSQELPAPSPRRPVAAAPPAAVTPPAPPAPVAPEPAGPDAFDSDEAIAAAEGKPVDPEDFARATDEFMRSSPVLGAAPRRATRGQDLPDFGDPDAIAVASMVQDLTRMEVPKERHAEVRARLLDLARRLERGELEWSALRKAVWFAMEHPELARRLMPVLLPWIDRAA